jgi:DNA polymerase III alpha subunit (gram-positive type)
VVHNSEFDLGFINQQFLKNFNFELGNQSICTVKIARAILKTLVNHKLHTVAEYFGIPMQNRHRAQGDATILTDVWRNLIEVLKKNHISTILDLRKSAWIS